MTEYFTNFYALILDLEQKSLVTRTFRRLDPQRQQALLNAILDEAAEVGPADLNIRRVAERCGSSVGSLYQYFGSRANLLAFTIELVVRTTVDTFNAYRSYLVEMPLLEALQAYLTGGMEWTREQMGMARFFARIAYHGDPVLGEQVVQPIATVLTGMVRDILQAAQQRGEVHPELDVDATARILNTLLIAVADAQLLPYLNTYYQLTGENLDPERSMRALLALVANGLAAEVPHA